MTEKEIKRATFEANMLSQNRKVAYLDLGDIMDIINQNKLGEINLETYEYYRNDFEFQRRKNADIETAKAKQRIVDYQMRVEEDKQKVVEYCLRQNNALPWQLRKDPELIKNEIKRIVGQPMIGSEDYKEKLANYMGGTIDERGRRIDIDEAKVNARLIQKDFERRQAEKKAAKQETPLAGTVEGE